MLKMAFQHMLVLLVRATLTYLCVIVQKKVISSLKSRPIVGSVALIPLHDHSLIRSGWAARATDLHHSPNVPFATVLAAPLPVHSANHPHPNLHAGIGVRVHRSAQQPSEILHAAALGDGRQQLIQQQQQQHVQHTWEDNVALSGVTPNITALRARRADPISARAPGAQTHALLAGPEGFLHSTSQMKTAQSPP